MNKKELEDKVVEMVKTVYDPEIPVDVFELGLIYNIDINENADVKITMTLTSPSCPVAESLPLEVEEKVGMVHGVNKATVEVTFDPPWDRDMMSEEAQLELGFL